MAQQHFNAYIAGVPLTTTPITRPPSPPAPHFLPPSPPPSRPPSGLAQSTYATATQTPPAGTAAITMKKTGNKPSTLAAATKQPPPDTRLFVRLPPNHIVMGPCPIQGP
jgi:hypothetical protein